MTTDPFYSAAGIQSDDDNHGYDAKRNANHASSSKKRPPSLTPFSKSRSHAPSPPPPPHAGAKASLLPNVTPTHIQKAQKTADIRDPLLPLANTTQNTTGAKTTLPPLATPSQKNALHELMQSSLGNKKATGALSILNTLTSTTNTPTPKVHPTPATRDLAPMFKPGFSAAKAVATASESADKGKKANNKRARPAPTGVVMNPKTGDIFFRKKDGTTIPHTL
jgi:hypothetical protein